MKRRGNYPHWAFQSHRAFKARKRWHLANVARALDDLNTGSAFLPFYAEVDEVRNRITAWRKALSVKEWGR